MHITNCRSLKPNRIWVSPSLCTVTIAIATLLVFGLPGLLEAQSATHVNALRVAPATPAGQEFFCVGPYFASECEAQTALLQAVLRRYDAERLGKWSWIVIRSEDWKQFASQFHLDPASPAFSHLGYRQTFFDEALLVLKPKRELELVTKWNVSFDRFLDLAVSHELGHAFCQESDEVKAERFGQRLRKNLPNACETKKQQRNLPRTDHKITVRIHNYTEASLSFVQRAERAAGNILKRAGVTTVWIECPVRPNFSHKPICDASYSSLDFVVNLLPRFMSDRFHLEGGELGLAIDADEKNYGCRAFIFYDVARDWARQQKQDLDQLLGAAIAHELGHLLLGTNSHSPTGLMSAFWSPKQLMAVQQRGLDFSPADAEHAQKAVARRRAALSPSVSSQEITALTPRGTL